MIYVIAELRFRTEMTEKVFAAARKIIADTVKEDGCISYDMHQSMSDPSRLVELNAGHRATLYRVISKRLT
jgi:quinol monooxygenase YgiN